MTAPPKPLSPAEIEALRLLTTIDAQAKLIEIAREMADQCIETGDAWFECKLCGRSWLDSTINHRPDCPVAKFRFEPPTGCPYPNHQ